MFTLSEEQSYTTHKTALCNNRKLSSPIPAFTFGLDIVGPLPAVSNCPNRYILSSIDRSTNWIEATPFSSITAEVVAETFISPWFSQFGVPLYITTYQGRQFESDFFAELSKLLFLHVFVLHLITPKSMVKSKSIIEL